MGRALLASGQRGSHNGLPMMMVITTTLHDLQSGTGHAVTGGGGLLPMSEVIRQASKAHHYLAVFDKHTAEPLYLGRAKRLASTAQRIMLYAQDCVDDHHPHLRPAPRSSTRVNASAARTCRKPSPESGRPPDRCLRTTRRPRLRR